MQFPAWGQTWSSVCSSKIFIINQNIWSFDSTTHFGQLIKTSQVTLFTSSCSISSVIFFSLSKIEIKIYIQTLLVLISNFVKKKRLFNCYLFAIILFISNNSFLFLSINVWSFSCINFACKRINNSSNTEASPLQSSVHTVRRNSNLGQNSHTVRIYLVCAVTVITGICTIVWSLSLCMSCVIS